MRAALAGLFALSLTGCFLDRGGIVGSLDAGPRRDAGPDTGVIDRDSGPCTTPVPEICDGNDDDCDGNVDEDFPTSACDSSDVDACPDDVFMCVSGIVTCVDDGESDTERELCDGMDNDCVGTTADGSEEAMFGEQCDGGDSDDCPEGRWACDGSSIVCDDATGDDDESCNAVDDDCDGDIDDGVCGGGGCDHFNNDGHSYIFCDTDLTWSQAQAACVALGYELLHIDDATENAWVDSTTTTNQDMWIGANDNSSEGNFVWADDGTAVTYTNWEASQPNDTGGQDCVEFDRDDSGASGASGAWNDENCSTTSGQAYACEAAPP